jgi:uncharacterized protein YggE
MWSLAAAAAAFGAGMLIAARPAPAGPALATTTGVIRTTGSAVVRVRPDKASLRMGVETFAATPRESQAANARLIEAVLKAVRAKDVLAQDISTDYYALRPEYDDYNGHTRRVVGYWTNNTVLVSLRQVGKLSDVLAAALEAGATSVDGVTFSTTRLRELRDQARAMAVKAALEKARDMAAAAGATVGDVQSLSDDSMWQYAGWMWSGGMSAASNLANMTQNVAQASSGASDAPDDGEFSLGQIVVQAQVELTAALGR